MRGLALGVATLVLAGFTQAAPLAAQGVRFGVGGGPTFVLEDGGGTDFHIMGTAAFAGGEDLPVSFRVDGQYQLGDAADVLSGTANAVYSFEVSDETKFRPYLIGGLGIYNINPDFEGADSETKFGINAGAGFSVPVGQGSTRLFGEARFHNIFTSGENLNLLPITVGVMFGGS
ncbi:MAG TPA: outer membrane beta-barrel protein [Gemmatimonadales bacterium]|nr:outer membrane beta-barrel protein [Gemmatimonadales bacterium]